MVSQPSVSTLRKVLPVFVRACCTQPQDPLSIDPKKNGLRQTSIIPNKATNLSNQGDFNDDGLWGTGPGSQTAGCCYLRRNSRLSLGDLANLAGFSACASNTGNNESSAETDCDASKKPLSDGALPSLVFRRSPDRDWMQTCPLQPATRAAPVVWQPRDPSAG